MPFTDAEVERYARQLVLKEIGGQGQQALKAARVLIVGAGGLGAPAALYLAASGVGRIGLVDADVVALSNLQRQVLFTTADVGKPKTVSAAGHLAALNPHVEIVSYPVMLTAPLAWRWLGPWSPAPSAAGPARSGCSRAGHATAVWSRRRRRMRRSAPWSELSARWPG